MTRGRRWGTHLATGLAVLLGAAVSLPAAAVPSAGREARARQDFILTIETVPPEAMVSVDDGEPRPDCPTFMVTAGPHRVRVTLAGYKTVEMQVDLTASKFLNVTLERDDGQAPPPVDKPALAFPFEEDSGSPAPTGDNSEPAPTTGDDDVFPRDSGSTSETAGSPDKPADGAAPGTGGQNTKSSPGWSAEPNPLSSDYSADDNGAGTEPAVDNDSGEGGADVTSSKDRSQAGRLAGSWILIGTGLALVAGGTALAVTGALGEDDVKSHHSWSMTKATDEWDSMQSRQSWGISLACIGGAAATGGIIWLVAGKPADTRRWEDSAFVVPLPGGASLGWTVSF